MEGLYSEPPTWSLVFNLDLMAIWSLSNKVCNIPLHTIPPIYFSQVMVHLCRTRKEPISTIFFHDPLLELIGFGTHDLSWHLNTPSPPYWKFITISLWTFAFNSSNMGSLSCFSFTFDTNEDSASFITITLPSLESNKQTLKCASLWTSLANSFSLTQHEQYSHGYFVQIIKKTWENLFTKKPYGLSARGKQQRNSKC